ncbi:hypothetical protein AJ80_02355 [Polytolypa hystricis UAMH7299]|uniref:Uncharacterized protein n=1 Tax=Polytolypa hystricis (strain UAMH7299) TaxID=1447883 RepID=A0A2B7YQI9_POLH7|nr:hypothetical protein AJ80_02355 [Polytolypa hystricis UAMH7299]
MASLANLRDARHFPNYASCPEHTWVDRDFYSPCNEREEFFRPNRHWCLTAQVVEVNKVRGAPIRAALKDKAGKLFSLKFPHNRPKALDVNKGDTVALMYAGTLKLFTHAPQIYLEHVPSAVAIPCTLPNLLALNDRLQTELKTIDGKHTCQDCQTKAWDENDHKRDCCILRPIQSLFRLDWEKFDDFHMLAAKS